METSPAGRLRTDVLHLSNVIGPRAAGSREDQAALRVIADRMKALGLDCKVEEFKFTESIIEEWSLSVAGSEIPSIPCVSTPSSRGNISAPIIDVGYGTDEEMVGVEGKIVLARIGKIHESFKAEKARERGAVGALFFAEEEEWGIYTGRLRYPRGRMPAFCISSFDGRRLSALARSGTKAVMSVTAGFKESVGRNLLAESAGTEDEYVIVTAHRDSRPHSPGANDNVSGGAVMMEVARGIASKRKGRSVLFISTDAEEYGLCGSVYHVETRKARLSKYAAEVNLDSMGQGTPHVVERDRAGALSPRLNALVVQVGREMGSRVKKRSFQNGSDCDPFMQAGVDACWIRGFPNTSFNSTTDTFEKLDYQFMSMIAKLSQKVIEKLTDPREWRPTPRAVS
jgi:aminopeptidase YwaD